MNLLTRLEYLTAPSREVSDELLLSWGWTKDPPHARGINLWAATSGEIVFADDRPHPTASIDDALLGKPDGCNMDHQYIHSKGTWLVDIWFSFQPKSAYAYNASLPLALCIAIVKARGGV